MTQYEKLNLKFNWKNATEVELKLLLNMIGDSKDDTNFPYKWLLSNRQSSKLHKDFANNPTPNMKLSNT